MLAFVTLFAQVCQLLFVRYVELAHTARLYGTDSLRKDGVVIVLFIFYNYAYIKDILASFVCLLYYIYIYILSIYLFI